MGATGSARWSTMAREVAPSTFLEAILEMSDDAIFTCDVAARVTASSVEQRMLSSTVRSMPSSPSTCAMRCELS